MNRPRATALGTLLLAAAITSSGCTPRPSPATWTEPARYSFILLSQCGERSLIGRFRVHVIEHATVLFERLDQSARAFQGRTGEVPTLAWLLAHALDAREHGASVVNVTLDPADGHPTRVEIDWRVDAIDDEECYSISEYATGY